jgi:hypothetical protein
MIKNVEEEKKREWLIQTQARENILVREERKRWEIGHGPPEKGLRFSRYGNYVI